MNCPQKLIKWRRTDIDLIRCQRATISSTIDKFLHLLIKMKIVWPFIPSMVMYFREGCLGIKSENTNKTIERRAWRYQREVIRISKSKNDRQHNGQKKIDTRISNDLQNITYNKTKDRVTRTQLKSEGELRCSVWSAVPAPLMTLICSWIGGIFSFTHFALKLGMKRQTMAQYLYLSGILAGLFDAFAWDIKGAIAYNINTAKSYFMSHITFKSYK